MDERNELATRLVGLAHRLLSGAIEVAEARAELGTIGAAPFALTAEEAPRVAQAAEKRASWREDVEAVFAHWKARTGHERAMLSPERVKKIRARLQDGFTVAELQSAINGCSTSEFHMGGGHDDLTLICRDASHVEKFIKLAQDRGAALRAPAKEPTPHDAERERLSKEIAQARSEGRISDYNRLVADFRAKGFSPHAARPSADHGRPVSDGRKSVGNA